MRGILRHQSSGRRRRARPQTRLFARRAAGSAPDRSIQAGGRDASAASSPTPAPTAGTGSSYDSAAQRVRAAGGPNDQASYTCVCGYMFAAPVSTSVRCPHCGAEQDW
jgi:hypothetical protein